MSNRLRGLTPAYKAGRLDEYIRLRFGEGGYQRYVLKRMYHRIIEAQKVMLRLSAHPK